MTYRGQGHGPGKRAALRRGGKPGRCSGMTQATSRPPRLLQVWHRRLRESGCPGSQAPLHGEGRYLYPWGPRRPALFPARRHDQAVQGLRRLQGDHDRAPQGRQHLRQAEPCRGSLAEPLRRGSHGYTGCRRLAEGYPRRDHKLRPELCHEAFPSSPSVSGSPMRQSYEVIESLLHRKVAMRLAMLLVNLGDRPGEANGEATRLDVRLTHQDLANKIA